MFLLECFFFFFPPLIACFHVPVEYMSEKSFWQNIIYTTHKSAHKRRCHLFGDFHGSVKHGFYTG